nr:hypothetical protein [uncultured Vibrio sp.]
MGKGAQKVEETREQKQYAKVAAEQWNRYQDAFVDVENEYIRQAHSMGDEKNYDKITEAANTTSNSATSTALNHVQKGLSSRGINPNTGKATSITSDIVTDGSNKESQTAAQGNHNVTQRYTGNLQNVVAMGQGQKTTATAGLQDIASASGLAARSNAMTKASEASIPAAAAGIAASYYGSEYGKKPVSDDVTTQPES